MRRIIVNCQYAPQASARYLSHFAALGKLLDKGLLAHITSLTDKEGHKTGESSEAAKISPVLSIGASLPPVPQKLVNRIQAGEFVDMAELLPDRMGVTSAPLFAEKKDDKQPAKTKRRQVTNILEWVQCYSIYIAVLTARHPNRIQDLMGYQALIVKACPEYGSETWLGYDRRFCQLAAASPDTVWAKIDPTPWNMAFLQGPGQGTLVQIFSLTHQRTVTGPRPLHQRSCQPHPTPVAPNGSATCRFVIPGTTAQTLTVHTPTANIGTFAFTVPRTRRLLIKTTKHCTVAAAALPLQPVPSHPSRLLASTTPALLISAISRIDLVLSGNCAIALLNFSSIA